MSTKLSDLPESPDLKVYVSSTFSDLEEYRSVVNDALRKMEIIAVCMEDYVARDERPVDKCLSDVSKCDIYIGIFAWRYGFIPPGHGKSITELEYRKAVEAGIPTLIFLLNEKTDWPFGRYGNEEDQIRIKALKSELKLIKTVSWFTNAQDLVTNVMAAASIQQKEIDKARMANIQSERYKEVGIAKSPEQKASIQQAISLEQEAMQQQSLRAQRAGRDPIPIQLPKLCGSFVDRDIECDLLFHCLRETDNRLVVIIAPGGYGKTELATRVLKKIAPGTGIVVDDVHGILYIRCAKGEINLGKIFDGAGKIAGKKDEFLGVYTSKETALTGKLEFFFNELSKVGNIWLVMDNFEDLLDADDGIKDAELRGFLETAAAIEHNVRLIATSRVVPKFKGSRRIETVDLSSGLPEDQAILYLREEGAKYGLRNENEVVLRNFVRQVHCIPMALASVLGYLEEHYPAIKLFDLLVDDGLFQDFDRHDLTDGLKSLILQQIKRIPPDVHLVLSALSIFSKPTSPAALRYLLQGIGAGEFAAILTRLEKNRLIIHNNGYYDMHPVIRSFVYERIPESEPSGNGRGDGKDGETALLTRSGLHKKAAEFFEKLRKPKKDWKTIDDLEPQLQEIHHLMRAGQYEEAARVLNSIDFNYLQLWGYPVMVIELREQFTGKLKDTYFASVNAGYLGSVYEETGRVRESLPFLEQAVKGAKDNDDKNGIIIWLGYLGYAYLNLGETRKAIEYHEQALATHREIKCMEGEGYWLGNLGEAYFYLGESRKAIEYYEQALATHREIKCRCGEGYWLGDLGEAYLYLGESRNAIEYLEEALVISRKIGERRIEGIALGNLGDACFIEGGFDKAVEHYQQALGIAKKIENPIVLTSEILIKLAYAFHYHSNLNDAEKYYRESLKFDVPLHNCQGAVLLGILLFQKGEHINAEWSSESEDFIKRGISLCRQILEKTPDLFRQRYKLALALLASGDSQASLETYRQALSTCSAKGVVNRVLMDLSILERAAPNIIVGLADARKLLTDAPAAKV